MKDTNKSPVNFSLQAIYYTLCLVRGLPNKKVQASIYTDVIF